MKLILQNGYPFPFRQINLPDDFDCRENELTIEGVAHFEWKHTLTVEFTSVWSFLKAKQATGWRPWDNSGLILEAATSTNDGYDHPAICTRDTAYCGFILTDKI